MKLIAKLWSMLAILMLVMAFSAVAADAEVVDLTKSSIPQWAVTIISVVAGLAGTYAMWCVSKLINLIFGQKWQEGAKAGAITALQHGIQDAEEEMVAELKNDTSDGKLTQEEVDRAKKLAFKRAMEVATGPALDMLKQWGIDIAGNLISQLIQGKKAAANTVVVNATNVDSIQAPVNTNLKVDETPPAAATVEATATVVKAVTAPVKHFRPTPEEINQALIVLAAANRLQVTPEQS